MDKRKSRFQPLVPTKSSRRIDISSKKDVLDSPETPTTEINWSSVTTIKHPR